MIYKLLYIGTLLLALQCNQKVNQHYSSEEIFGEWTLIEDQTNYPTLQFNKNSTAIFRSKADTMYFFRFNIKDDSLDLLDINNKKVVNKIKTLDSNRLIFYNLLEHNEVQVYKRESK